MAMAFSASDLFNFKIKDNTILIWFWVFPNIFPGNILFWGFSWQTVAIVLNQVTNRL
jgi:hypothetical protein